MKNAGAKVMHNRKAGKIFRTLIIMGFLFTGIYFMPEIIRYAEKVLHIELFSKNMESGTLLSNKDELVGDLEDLIGLRKGAPCIVIDAGHGGRDGGKIGVNGALEKDVNLAITFLVKAELEKQGFQVILTRDSDDGLYSEDTSNKKMEDLNNRAQIIEETNPLFIVSIHQNSFQQENVCGAQVFYYAGSEKSEALARAIQEQIVEDLQPENHREIKANDNYYLLRKVSQPMVIVECGFLSNNNEAANLINPEYQQKMAESIAAGIVDFYTQNNYN